MLLPVTIVAQKALVDAATSMQGESIRPYLTGRRLSWTRLLRPLSRSKGGFMSYSQSMICSDIDAPSTSKNKYRG